VGVGDVDRELNELYLYPNPAHDRFYLDLGARAENQGRIELLDMSGRPVVSELVPRGYKLYEVNIGHLTRGMYIVHWIESGKVRGISKIVKTE
jgi:hypothetical protein